MTYTATFISEIVRAGILSVQWGQTETARALGLSDLQTLRLVIFRQVLRALIAITLFIGLPQALRAVIPAIVGQFISLFKDTSLVVIVGLLDLVGIRKSIILGNVQWIGSQREVDIFLAAVFWVFTYSMSYASRKLEETLVSASADGGPATRRRCPLW